MLKWHRTQDDGLAEANLLAEAGTSGLHWIFLALLKNSQDSMVPLRSWRLMNLFRLMCVDRWTFIRKEAFLLFPDI